MNEFISDVSPADKRSVGVKNLPLLAFVLILFFLNFYNKTLFFRPGSIHQWRQTDCLSIAKNYYEEGMRFFEPKIHYQGVPGGKAVSEFPILNYTVAALWKVFGEHEFIYRLLEYFIFITAIFVFYNTLLRFYKSVWLSFFATGVLLTSPLLAYYGLNFIADVPAFSIGLIAFCLFFRFYHEKKIKIFYLALVLASLAVLMKASALMAFVLILFFSALDISGLNGFFRTEKLFIRKLWPTLVIMGLLTLIISWYRFAVRYNDNDNDSVFLLTVLPIWEMDEAQLIYNLKVLFNTLFPLFLNKPMFFIFLMLCMYVVARFRTLSSFLKYAFLFSGLFFIAYILFFFQVFGVHDYYLINIMIFPVITLVSFIHLITQTQFVYAQRNFLRVFVISVLLFSSFHCAAVYRMRSIEDDKMVFWFPFISEEERNLAKWLFWDYSKAVKKIEDFEPVLREAGINREDKVLSIPDHSFDISLYLMDQKGYTVARDHIKNDTAVMAQFMNKVDYIVLSDTSLKREKAFTGMSHYFTSLFVHDNGVEVFKMNHRK